MNKLNEETNLINNLNQTAKNQLDQELIKTNDQTIENQFEQQLCKTDDDQLSDDGTNEDKPCPICDEYYVHGEFWIMCDACKIWYHCLCVNVDESDVNEIEEYHCKFCSSSKGPSIYNHKNNHRYDRSIDDSNHSLPTQIGTTKFIEELKQNRKFKKLEKVYKLDGYDVTMNFLLDNGFDRPILVKNPEGLKMKIPTDFSLKMLLDKLGDNYPVEVINVYRQETDNMKLIELVNALNIKERDEKSKVLNCISLELSLTQLADEIEPPFIVRHELSWADNVFSEQDKPAVQKYLLLSMKDSYTDFHIDFSGTSVWYHIFQGSKIFYFIEPTEKNINAYEKWLVKDNHSEIFFPDEIDDECYFYELKQGDTMLLPTGWIHGVYTPDDSIVFGGNFLNTFRADLQIKIFELEERQQTADKFKFPAFKLTHWVAVKFVYGFLKDLIDDNRLTKESCRDDPKFRKLYNSFKAYYEFTLNYFNEIDKTKLDDEEILAVNSFKYSKTLSLIAKLLDKICPYDENIDKKENKNSKINSALNNYEDLPQKSVKLQSEDTNNNLVKRKRKESSIINSVSKRRKNLLPLESKRSKVYSTKFISPPKPILKFSSTQLGDQISTASIKDSISQTPKLDDDKKRKLINLQLFNFKIPKKPKLMNDSSGKDDDQLNCSLSSNNSIQEQQINSDNWNDSLALNKSDTSIENKSEPKTKLELDKEKISLSSETSFSKKESDLNGDEDWDSPCMNTFEVDQSKESNESIIKSELDKNLPSINKSDTSIENKSEPKTKLELDKEKISLSSETSISKKESITNDDDWDSPSMNTFEKIDQPKEKNESITNDDWDSPSINTFEKIDQLKQTNESITNDKDLPNMDTFEKSKEIKLNSSTPKCIYSSYDIRSSNKFANKNNINSIKSDEKIDKPSNDSSNRQVEIVRRKSFDNDQQKSNFYKPRNNGSYQKSLNNDHQDLNNNGNFNSYNNRRSNYNTGKQINNYNNSNRNYNNNSNNSRNHVNQTSYNNNQRNHKNYQSNNNYNKNRNNNYINNNSNRNFNNKYENKRKYNNGGGNQFSNNNNNYSYSNNRTSNFNNSSPNNNYQSNRNNIDSNKYNDNNNYTDDKQSKIQPSNTINETSEFGSDWE